MVKNMTSLTGNGLRDWLIQRVTARLLLVYVLILTVFFILNPHPDFESWHGLFSHMWMKVISILFFLSLILHAWIGLWSVLTDYIKSYVLRMVLEVLMIVGLLACFIWSIIIIGSV
jgi:succinate dehydrogenase / fumarate reductase, membrane anchor subunit